MAQVGDVGTEIAPATTGDAHLARLIDELLRRTCDLARALTQAEQAALKVDLRRDGAEPRKFFSLSSAYDRWRDYRVDPRGLGLHGIDIAAGEVVRLTQTEVEAHPAWQAFGTQAGKHPPMRGWLATHVCGEDGASYGLLQLSDKAGGADFSARDGELLVELAAYAGAALDALREAHEIALR